MGVVLQTPPPPLSSKQLHNSYITYISYHVIQYNKLSSLETENQRMERKRSPYISLASIYKIYNYISI